MSDPDKEKVLDVDSDKEVEKVDDDEKPAGSSAGAICRKALNFFFSTAGLFVINALYLMIGGSLFEHLEKYNEEQVCYSGAENYDRAENATQTLMLDVATKIAHGALQQKGGDGLIRDDYQHILRSFSLSVLDIGYNISKNCSLLGQPGGPQYAWSWSGSLVFAMTVTTTIGYGVIAPKTQWGRMVCIAYAIVGLPIMLICLANVGDVMAEIFRFVYATVCCCGCCRTKPKKKEELSTPVTVWRTDSTGRPIPSDQYEEEDDSDDEDDEAPEDQEITVPLTISLIVLFTFVFFGAALFSVWEDWGYLDALYFCFVTFSTLGFGDIVPGTTNLDSPESQAQLIVTGVWQILGMAMVSMCFQLMQDEMIAKFQWLGQKCGIGKKKEDVGDDSNDDEEEEKDDKDIERISLGSKSPRASPRASSRASSKASPRASSKASRPRTAIRASRSSTSIQS